MVQNYFHLFNHLNFWDRMAISGIEKCFDSQPVFGQNRGFLKEILNRGLYIPKNGFLSQ